MSVKCVKQHDIVFSRYIKHLSCVLVKTAGDSLSADVSNSIYWVTEASRRLSVCEEKQDRFVFFYGLEKKAVVRRFSYPLHTDRVTEYVPSHVRKLIFYQQTACKITQSVLPVRFRYW